MRKVEAASILVSFAGTRNRPRAAAPGEDRIATTKRFVPLPPRIEPLRRQLADWASLLGTGRANQFKEQELLPEFLTVYFHGVLGYTGPADSPGRYTLSREHHVQVDGKFADAVLNDRMFALFHPTPAEIELLRREVEH
jgi:hypothetical protein